MIQRPATAGLPLDRSYGNKMNRSPKIRVARFVLAVICLNLALSILWGVLVVAFDVPRNAVGIVGGGLIGAGNVLFIFGLNRLAMSGRAPWLLKR